VDSGLGPIPVGYSPRGRAKRSWARIEEQKARRRTCRYVEDVLLRGRYLWPLQPAAAEYAYRDRRLRRPGQDGVRPGRTGWPQLHFETSSKTDRRDALNPAGLYGPVSSPPSASLR